MSGTELNEIQQLQFVDRPQAEQRLLSFLLASGSSDASSVRLNPKPESLNSINGFVTFVDGSTLFFKSHTEENEVLEEYYRQQILQDAGYPLMLAREQRSTPGQQIAFYEVIDLPTLFDAVKVEEDRQYQEGSGEGAELCASQRELDKRIFRIYCETLEEQAAEHNERQSIHQLFWHRLAPQGRYDIFYKDAVVPLPQGGNIAFADLAKLHWRVNGVTYDRSLGECVDQARTLLHPRQPGPSSIGHGDAHNGNVFYKQETRELFYFDPAFAGRHDPILDLTKPLFHNVFARWMYFPEEVSEEFELTCSLRGDLIEVEHSFMPSSLRQAFLRSKLEEVLRPLCKELPLRGYAFKDWRNILAHQLLCCPLLTVNLAADFTGRGKLAQRYSEAVKFLGLSLSIEFASSIAQGSSPLRDLINEIYS